jgi:enediyne biosynthesis protein E4
MNAARQCTQSSWASVCFAVLLAGSTCGWMWISEANVAAQERSARASVGVLSFSDITAGAAPNSVTGSHGAAWADVTGDGLPDLYLTYNECRSGTRRNRFYRNLGGGAFVEEAVARGLGYTAGGSHGGAWADLDNDGDYDLLSGDTYLTDCNDEFPPPASNRVLLNNDGVFVDRTPPAMAAYRDYTRSIFAFDADRDGRLDIFAVNGDAGSVEPLPDRNEFYHNDGNSNFTALTSGPLITTPAGQAGAATDFDGDGDIDILLPNATGELGVVRNDNGVFTAIPPASIGIQHQASESISSGDLNNDGQIDLVLIDQDRSASPPLGFAGVAYVYLNAGGGMFSYKGEIQLFGGYTAGLADLDNDGDLDITLPGLPYVLLNDGAAGFTRGPDYPTPMATPGCGGAQCMKPDPRTVAFADIDADGDLDSVVTAKFGSFRIIRNEFNAGNWLKVQLTSPQGQAGAFGAQVRVYRAGTTSLIALREAKSEYGYLSQDDPVLHIGVGSATSVDVKVRYLDGSGVVRQNVAVNQRIAFIGTAVAVAPSAPRDLTATVNGSSVALTWNSPLDGPAPTAYRLDVGSASGLANLAVVPVGFSNSFAANAPNGTYFVRVRAQNRVGASAPSNEVAVTVGRSGGGVCVAPPAPATLTFQRTGSAVTLNWAPPANGAPVRAYVIEAGSGSGAANIAIVDTGAPILTVSANAPPGRYFVRVRARVACGTGSPSTEVVIDVP